MLGYWISLALILFVTESSTYKLGKFELLNNSGWPRHNITSDSVDLLDSRRIIIRGLQGLHKGPFAFWTVRLKSASHGTAPPLDQLGDFRDNLILSDPEELIPCNNPKDMSKGQKRDVILTLPKQYTWNDVAWMGQYCFGYTYVFNYIWISHYPNGIPRDLPIKFQSEGYHDLISDAPDCTRQITPCKDNSVKNVDINGDFCYRRCEVVPELFPELDDGFHCGAKLRDESKLFGCIGVRPEELRQGETLPRRECRPGIATIPFQPRDNKIELRNFKPTSIYRGNFPRVKPAFLRQLV